jgi:hypothetical protein
MTETTQGASVAPGDPAADAAALIGQIFGGTVTQIPASAGKSTAPRSPRNPPTNKVTGTHPPDDDPSP